ncbi:MAG: acyl-CoA synthetase [Pseudomonadales bacterium]|nr:acyl-CoA synthetase [Pseudomonadales bacterium]
MYPGRHPGHKIAYEMVGTGRQVTYGELEADSNRAAHLFRGAGLGPGGGIAILLPNCEEYLKIAWAAQRAGLYYTPISVLFQQREIDYILSNSDASLLITNRDLVRRVSPEVLANLDVYLTDEGETGRHWASTLGAMPTHPIADESEGAEMIYSSGTTGQPKGVRFPLKGLPLGTVAPLVQTRIALHEIDESVRYLSTAPLYHSAPLRYNLMVTRLGGTAYVMEKFDAEQALALIATHRITHSQWVPTMFVRLLKLPEAVRARYDVSSLKFAIHAAAPCPVTVKDAMIDWFGPILYEYYSGTEANGSTAITSREWLSHKGSVGRAIHGELHILDDDGVELPVGETGTVYFANGSDFSYYKDPEKTRAARSSQGWTTLGDIGYVDDEGYLYLKDRKSFMIISGGVNIYPQEVEDCLVTHPAVADVAVFGVPNDEFGEEVKAAVQLVDPALASPALAQGLIDWCRERISHAKCPRSVDFEPELPRHPTGKLYKRKLRDRYWLDAPSA